jgi:hypothetical protein
MMGHLGHVQYVGNHFFFGMMFPLVKYGLLKFHSYRGQRGTVLMQPIGMHTITRYLVLWLDG